MIQSLVIQSLVIQSLVINLYAVPGAVLFLQQATAGTEASDTDAENQD